MMEPKLIAIIPHYNHSDKIGNVINQLHKLNLPVLVVDDGSSEQHKKTLSSLSEKDNLHIHYCSQNQGKGGAMKVGFRLAFEQGFTHVLQVDADGQHNLIDALLMLQKMLENPTALICGNPIYGDDAPKSRLYGRKITDFWNAIHTLSLDIKDGMCGFRLYPLNRTIEILDNEHIGNRMDFDIEIIIKAHWYQIPLIWVDTPVSYDKNGVSHFNAWKDNVLISKMHMYLFFGMLKRLLTGKPL